MEEFNNRLDTAEEKINELENEEASYRLERICFLYMYLTKDIYLEYIKALQINNKNPLL